MSSRKASQIAGDFKAGAACYILLFVGSRPLSADGDGAGRAPAFEPLESHNSAALSLKSKG